MREALKCVIASIVIVLLAGSTRAPAAAQAGAEAAEAARLSREVVELYKAGKYAQALPLAERAVALGERSPGAEDGALASALSNLGGVLSALGKADRALEAYERALAILEKRQDADDALTNQTREDVAGIYFKKGDYGKARVLLERTLSGREKTLGAGDRLLTRTLVELGYVYIVTRDSAKRDATFRRLLDMAATAPEPTLEEASNLFQDYVCTGATHPNASDEQKEIEGRIQQLWYARKHGAQADGAVSGGLLSGRAIRKPQPGYPPEARQGRVQGTVLVRVLVNEAGKVLEAEPVCGPRALRDASVQAARQWTFTPTLLNGAPVKVRGTITFTFVLR
ncbi:MAG TPA: TonB family protein [Pyrinomonadaceae bacterium]|jgi:TonB family protein|nr:TonB family protein [Pyrinomonadaceae bacterium]